MADSKLRNVRVLGVGHLGVAIASYFNGEALTSGLDYDSESLLNCRVDNALQLKEFDGGFGQKIGETLMRERGTILDNFSGSLVFVIAQIEGRFQESVIPPLLKILRSAGSFTGFFPVIPIGSDKKREAEKIQRMKADLDMLEVVDSESLLSDSPSQRVLDINIRYYKHILEKVSSIARVIENSTALGISLHDIKMLTNLYGPVRVSRFVYPYLNFSIAERDFFDDIGRLPRDKIRRIYAVLEIGSEADSTEVISFIRKIRNRLGNIDFRQGFIHSQGDFGLIVLTFGSF